MPTYEYECKNCSHSFEIFQSMSDPPVKECPKCGKEVRRIIFGGTGVIFKGSGFYVTDKNKSPGKTEPKSVPPQGTDAPASKKEAGGETSKEKGAVEKSPKGRGSETTAEKPKAESKSE